MNAVIDINTRGLDPLSQRVFQETFDDLNRFSRLERQLSLSVPSETLSASSIGRYVKTNTTTFEAWYAAGMCNATALTTANPATGTLIAIPFVAESGYGADAITFEVTTVSGANGKARVGIYDSIKSPEGSFYPGSLVVQGSEQNVAVGTGSKSSSVSFSPTEGDLYFAAYNCGTANPTIRTVPVGGCYPCLGLPAALGAAPQVAYTVASTYSSNSLQSPFPSGATAHTTAIPAIYLRYGGPSVRTRRFPIWAVPASAFIIRRAAVVSSVDVARAATSQSFDVSIAVRRGGSSRTLGTYSSQANRLSAGSVFHVTGESPIDFVLAKDDVIEAVVTQRFRPWQDLSTVTLSVDIAYKGEP